ncbi:Bcr/CflA family efflux MFS transporter [Myroides albus]|uniref:Bcr/CflA family efflux MFS transporter n=1 Tax=Myroides albus TaxID=2562892 RepID=UPI002158EDCF|nr:Bcr/CflA family efflux MFS transporter [Myroides albus]UVD80427.1 Bcr/CflA family efflux MFS transporter [Myroides albus]
MKTKLSIGFMIVLMMFPQFVETIYSPALPSLAESFNITETTTLLTISLYFIAFAIGVIFWGIQSDYLGRRKAMIYGLLTYFTASIIALIAPNFEVILMARFLAAFGIAVGSVVTQTMMRDCYTGKDLAKVFSIMGVALSVSPVIGLLIGGLTSKHFGYMGVFSLLAILSILLVSKAFVSLPETKQNTDKATLKNTLEVAKRLYSDATIWKYALLVMSYNVLLFSYYSFAPFIFEKAGYDSTIYGYSGIVLAMGSFIGSYINKKAIEKGYTSLQMMKYASIIAIANAGILFSIQNTMFFLLPMLLIVASFGIAIPNILSQALANYKTSIGTAGALFGLLYYLLIGTGLYISSILPTLAIVLVLFSVIAVLTTFTLKKQ